MNLGAHFLPPLVGWLVAYPSVQAQAGTQAHCHPTSPTGPGQQEALFLNQDLPRPAGMHTPLRLSASHRFINAFLGIIPFGSRYPQLTLLVGWYVFPRLEGGNTTPGLLVTATWRFALPSSITSMTSSGLDTNRSVHPCKTARASLSLKNQKATRL